MQISSMEQCLGQISYFIITSDAVVRVEMWLIPSSLCLLSVLIYGILDLFFCLPWNIWINKHK